MAGGDASSRDVSVDLLEEAFETAALILAVHGERYLPLFLRMEAELERKRARQSAIARARQIAARVLD